MKTTKQQNIINLRILASEFCLFPISIKFKTTQDHGVLTENQLDNYAWLMFPFHFLTMIVLSFI